jgi:ATP-dependent exoDNAse (exonuclease V) beta subunit
MKFIKDNTFTPIEFDRSEKPGYVGVTTALSDNPEKQASLEKWRQRVGEEEADRISGESIIIGNYAHGRMEALLDNEDVLREEQQIKYNNEVIFDHGSDFFERHKMSSSKILQSADVVAERLEDFVKRYISKVYMQEFQLYSDQYKLIGKADALVEIDGLLTIIDYKNSRKQKKKEWVKDYILQVCAYSYMFEEVYGRKVDRAVVLVGLRKNIRAPLWQVFVVDPESYRSDPFFVKRENLTIDQFLQ